MSSPTRRPAARFASNVGLFALVLVLVLLAVHATRPPALRAPQPHGGRVAERLPVGFAAPTAPRHLSVPPVQVAVPALKIRSTLVRLGLDKDRSLEVPTDYGQAGWYGDGTAPGDPGAPAVVVGHVDSYTGPGIFYRLSELQKGDAVLVQRADGSTVRFVVYATGDYLKTAFPAHHVYAAGATPELRLITCSGTFSTRSRHYLSNHVVYARIAVGSHP